MGWSRSAAAGRKRVRLRRMVASSVCLWCVPSFLQGAASAPLLFASLCVCFYSPLTARAPLYRVGFGFRAAACSEACRPAVTKGTRLFHVATTVKKKRGTVWRREKKDTAGAQRSAAATMPGESRVEYKNESSQEGPLRSSLEHVKQVLDSAAELVTSEKEEKQSALDRGRPDAGWRSCSPCRRRRWR